MKTILSKIVLILIILMLLFSINTEVSAFSEIIQDGADFISKGEQGKDNSEIPITAESIQDVSGYIYNILLAAGVVIAVIVATVLGIQFMIGGAEGQAKVKEMILPFVVGCIIVFGGFGFWKIAISIGKQIENTAPTSVTLQQEDM